MHLSQLDCICPGSDLICWADEEPTLKSSYEMFSATPSSLVWSAHWGNTQVSMSHQAWDAPGWHWSYTVDPVVYHISLSGYMCYPCSKKNSSLWRTKLIPTKENIMQSCGCLGNQTRSNSASPIEELQASVNCSNFQWSGVLHKSLLNSLIVFSFNTKSEKQISMIISGESVRWQLALPQKGIGMHPVIMLFHSLLSQLSQVSYCM